jgi:hypothetical protein
MAFKQTFRCCTCPRWRLLLLIIVVQSAVVLILQPQLNHLLLAAKVDSAGKKKSGLRSKLSQNVASILSLVWFKKSFNN